MNSVQSLQTTREQVELTHDEHPCIYELSGNAWEIVDKYTAYQPR